MFSVVVFYANPYLNVRANMILISYKEDVEIYKWGDYFKSEIHISTGTKRLFFFFFMTPGITLQPSRRTFRLRLEDNPILTSND